MTGTLSQCLHLSHNASCAPCMLVVCACMELLSVSCMAVSCMAVSLTTGWLLCHMQACSQEGATSCWAVSSQSCRYGDGGKDALHASALAHLHALLLMMLLL